jgi:Lon protease-like protein
MNTTTREAVPLFPLKSVLFPGTVLHLKVFEARYLDLASQCLRDNVPFGVVALRAGAEAGRGEAQQFETHGTLAHIEQVDAEGANLLRLRCLGRERFEIVGSATRQDNGLWVARIETLAPDEVVSPEPMLFATVQALQQVITSLLEKGNAPFAEPYRLDDAGWVANRWCEILPIPLAAKHKLMTLPDPQARLRLVHEYLKGKGVVQ